MCTHTQYALAHWIVALPKQVLHSSSCLFSSSTGNGRLKSRTPQIKQRAARETVCKKSPAQRIEKVRHLYDAQIYCTDISSAKAGPASLGRKSRIIGESLVHALLTLQKAQRAYSRDSPLVWDWQPGVVGFALVEDMSVWSIGHLLSPINGIHYSWFRTL